MKKTHRGDHRVPASGYCSVAHKYTFTKDRAEELLVLLKGHQGKGGKVEQRAYECPWCHGWHVTSEPPPA